MPFKVSHQEEERRGIQKTTHSSLNLLRTELEVWNGTHGGGTPSNTKTFFPIASSAHHLPLPTPVALALLPGCIWTPLAKLRRAISQPTEPTLKSVWVQPISRGQSNFHSLLQTWDLNVQFLWQPWQAFLAALYHQTLGAGPAKRGKGQAGLEPSQTTGQSLNASGSEPGEDIAMTAKTN